MRPFKGTTKRGAWVLVVALLAAVGVALAAGADFYFLPSQHGTYSGPHLPSSESGTFSLPGYGAWFDVGFHVNTTVTNKTNNVTNYAFNVTEQSNGTETSPEEVPVFFMNATEFEDFQTNTSLNYLGSYLIGSTVFVCAGFSCGLSLPVNSSNGNFYFVWVDTSKVAVTASYDVTLGAT